VHPASLSAPSIPHLHIDLSSSACSDEPEGMEQQESDHERRQGSIDFAGEVSAHKQKERLPLGQRRYRTTVILRPDITEKERLDWTQRYNEVSGGLHLSFMFYTRFSLFLTVRSFVLFHSFKDCLSLVSTMGRSMVSNNCVKAFLFQ
jgi:hypothetical protein